MRRLQSEACFDIIEVYADEELDAAEFLSGTLTLPCRESYDCLSVKTHLMVSSALSRRFDFLIKIDSDFSMPGRTPRKAEQENANWSAEAAQSLLQDEGLHKLAYGGLVRTRSTRLALEAWMRKKDLKGNFRLVFPYADTTPDYYLGGLYLLRRDFCEFVAAHGAQTAKEHQKHLGGTEDIMIGRLYKLWTETATTAKPLR